MMSNQATVSLMLPAKHQIKGTQEEISSQFHPLCLHVLKLRQIWPHLLLALLDFRASSTSQVSSAVHGSDGMNSYFERERGKVQLLNAEAGSFVPVAANQPPLYTSGGDQPLPCWMGARSKVRNLELQPQATTSHQLLKLESKIKPSGTQSINIDSQLEPDHSAPLTQGSSDHGHLITVLERQNEITSLLVESLFFLPRRDIQIFDGDPLQFQTFILGL